MALPSHLEHPARLARSGHKRLPLAAHLGADLDPTMPAAGLTKRAACALYSSPASSVTLGVYEPVTIAWNTSCDYSLGAKIDLYLNVETASDGSQAVHEWTGQSFSSGSLTTELKPSWWNASTGAGSVQAQVSATTTGTGGAGQGVS